MRKSPFILAGLLTTTLSWTLTSQDANFTPCDKTYIQPNEVFLEDNIIHIETENQSGTTSAIYSDITGLYYQDIAEDFEEELATEDSVQFEDFFIDEIFSIYSDKPALFFDDDPLTFIPEEPPLQIHEAPIIIEELPLAIHAPSVAIEEPPLVIYEEAPPQVTFKPLVQLEPKHPPHNASYWPYCDKQR